MNLEEAARINGLLQQEPEYEQVKVSIELINSMEIKKLGLKEEIKTLDDNIQAERGKILNYLLALEDKTGFSKAPGLAHIMNIGEAVEVSDMDAVPKEYIVQTITSKVDKKKLNEDIKAGKIDKNSNWLAVRPGYRTVVIKA